MYCTCIKYYTLRYTGFDSISLKRVLTREDSIQINYTGFNLVNMFNGDAVYVTSIPSRCIDEITTIPYNLVLFSANLVVLENPFPATV